MLKIGKIELDGFPLLLAPMEDVSDPPFRALCKENGADIVYTEFISSEGLIRDAAKSIKKLDIYKNERPVGIQIFGSNLESMLKSIEIVENTNPDIIDINYGCPVKKVVCKGAGAGILKDIPLMIKLTKEMVKKTKLPVTVKTRLGWDERSIKIVEVAERLQDVGIAAISIHGRTRSQMYKGKADWTLISDVKNNPRMKIPVFGNGDVDSPEAALKMKNKFGLDGAMIGRASIGNPWIFNQIKHYFKFGEKLEEPRIIDKIDIVKRHFEMSVKWKGPKLAIYETRKHYGRYFKGIENIKKFKIKLISSNSVEEVMAILNDLRDNFKEPQLV